MVIATMLLERASKVHAGIRSRKKGRGEGTAKDQEGRKSLRSSENWGRFEGQGKSLRSANCNRKREKREVDDMVTRVFRSLCFLRERTANKGKRIGNERLTGFKLGMNKGCC